MTEDRVAVVKTTVQPGFVLHEVIVGASQNSGTTFNAWCEENGVQMSTARNATYGQSGGDKGQQLLERIITDAGRDVVLAAYRKRISKEAARLKESAA